MVSFADIERLVEKIAVEFDPEKIILFGSYARGAPRQDSDVDLLVILPFVGKSWRKAAEIRSQVRSRFPLDLLVRSPEEMRWRIKAGDPFLNEIVDQGVVLHAKDHARMD